jgi:hypothetical protein
MLWYRAGKKARSKANQPSRRPQKKTFRKNPFIPFLKYRWSDGNDALEQILIHHNNPEKVVKEIGEVYSPSFPILHPEF